MQRLARVAARAAADDERPACVLNRDLFQRVEAEISVHKARAAATADARTRLLADRLADTIAKLFYDHVITPDNREPGT